MSIKVRYFASLKEKLGRSEDTWEITDETTVLELWSLCVTEIPLPTNSLASINMEYVSLDALVHDGDEVAFFPLITGG